MSDFKPMLFPNEGVAAEAMTYPLMASFKLDGIRMIVKDGELLSRSLKPIENVQINTRYAALKGLSKNKGYIFDGELYAHGMSFQDIQHYVRTEDLGDEELPADLKYHVFDMIIADKPFTPAVGRVNDYMMLAADVYGFHPVANYVVYGPDAAREMFSKALDAGYEGLILKNPAGQYKFGRITAKSGDGYKFKPYRTWDAQIRGVEQATVVDPAAERKVNELGRHVTSKKKDDRIPVEKASAFLVDYEGKPLKVTLALTDPEKIEIWANRDRYVGRWIEYRGMEVGMKDVPRHPQLVRFRDDKAVA